MRASEAGHGHVAVGGPVVELEHDVRTFIVDNFVFDPAAEPVAADASLTQTGVLDSMGVLELILFLEGQYGFKIPDEDTLPENLDSVDRIVRYVQRRLEEGAGDAG